MEFNAIASSSSGNLYSVTEGSSTLLIECGIPFQRIREALDFRLSSVAGCLLSHSHGDHARAVHDVLGAGVSVYASLETLQALGALGHHRAEVVGPHWQLQIEDWTVKPFDLRHDTLGSLGFLIQSSSGERLLYACDTAYVPYRFRGLTHVAIECNYSAEILEQRVDSGALKPVQAARVRRHHLGLERVIEMLQANDLSDVREIHLLHLSAGNSDAETFKEAVVRATGKPVHVAAA